MAPVVKTSMSARKRTTALNFVPISTEAFSAAANLDTTLQKIEFPVKTSMSALQNYTPALKSVPIQKEAISAPANLDTNF